MYNVRCQSSAGAANTDDYGITFSVAGSSTGPVMRINSGGPAYVDSAGNSWDADHNYWGGDTISTGTAITGTTTPVIYQSARVGTNGYDIPMPNGSYTVHLKFAELQYSSVGQRVFDISLNDQYVIRNFDILEAAGGKDRAGYLTCTPTVTYGTFSLLLVCVNQPTAINTLENL